MLENERIIVQDRGYDAGLAALIQNANRGNWDPAAMMAMMNNNGFGGNGGWWWIFIFLLFGMWGGWGRGFGNCLNQAETNADFARLAAMGNQNNNTDLLMQAINGNKDDCNIIKAISDCCCTTQRSIDSVNLNITKMGYENQLANCNQTNTLQNAITSGFNSLLADNATKFGIIGDKIDAQTAIINDKFCQLEMREMQNKIDALRDEKNALQSSALLQQQTQNIVNQVRPCPVPAYLTCNPYGCDGGFGYGYGYNTNCGCC